MKKYDWLLRQLNEQQLYSAGTVAHTAKAYFEARDFVHRIRIYMNRLVQLSAFPPAGDGLLCIRGQALTRAWYGWRWKALAQSAEPEALDGSTLARLLLPIVRCRRGETWTREFLLQQQGCFMLTEVAAALGLDAHLLLCSVRQQQAQGIDVYETLGFFWREQQAVLDLGRFLPHYSQVLAECEMCDLNWSPQELLAKTGWFPLSQVCRILHLNKKRMVYLSRSLATEQPLVERLCYLLYVNMAVFAPFFRQLCAVPELAALLNERSLASNRRFGVCLRHWDGLKQVGGGS